MRTSVRAALTPLLALTVAAPALRAADLPPYEINTVLSLSGPATFVGKGISQSLDALTKVVNAQGGINGRPVRFVYYDDQSSPQVAVQLVTQIIAKNVPVILGPSFANTCRAVVPMVTTGPVLYCLSAGLRPVPRSYVFSPGTDVADSVLRNFEFLRKRGWMKIATLTTTDSTGQDADDNIDRALARPENAGFTVVDREHFNNTDLSVSAQLARIKAANPQALIAWTTGPPIGTVFQGLKTAGYDVPVFTTPGNQSYAEMKQFKDILPKELYLASAIYATGNTTRKNRVVLRAFYDAYAGLGVKPDQLSGDAWDPALILIDALRHAGPNPAAAQVWTYIEQLHDFPGIVGIYDFRDGSNRGVGLDDVLQTRWDVAKNIWVIVG